jgi:hypothetical protein
LRGVSVVAAHTWLFTEEWLAVFGGNAGK